MSKGKRNYSGFLEERKTGFEVRFQTKKQLNGAIAE